MLCAMRAIYAILAALLAGLALAGLLTPVWVLVVTALAGIVRPNGLVMRNSLIGETIPPDHLMGALGMSRATMDSARVGGALAGAGLSAMLGVRLTYVAVTALYVASLALTFGVAQRRPTPRGSSRWREPTDGVVRVLTLPELSAMMLLAFLINLTAYPVSGGLLPYVAQRVYHVDATGLGWLVASFAFGGLLASLTMVLTGGPRHPERATLIYTAIWYALLIAFGHLRHLGAGLLTLLVAGFVQNVAMISMTATLLAAAGEGFRDRLSADHQRRGRHRPALHRADRRPVAPARARPQAVAAFRSSSWRRTPAIIEARSEVSMTRSKPRFTEPAAKAALAQCMQALMPCLCAASRILSHVAMCTG